jgi:hypothetical protein
MPFIPVLSRQLNASDSEEEGLADQLHLLLFSDR